MGDRRRARAGRGKYWHFLLVTAPWGGLLAWVAHVAWFLCEDAFISFRYARNLLEGHGLVFNPGEYVEGYSNFLWTLELALLWALFDLRPEYVAPWLSVACTTATIATMLWWVVRTPSLLHNRTLVAWMALGLVCSSATFAVWTSGGGLETRQFTFFILLGVVSLALYRHSRWGLLTTALSLTAAAYTRPEGPLVAACCFAWFAIQHLLTNRRLPWRELGILVGPFSPPRRCTLPVPLQLLRRVATQHLLRQVCASLVRSRVPLLGGRGPRDRPVSVLAPSMSGSVDSLAGV